MKIRRWLKIAILILLASMIFVSTAVSARHEQKNPRVEREEKVYREKAKQRSGSAFHNVRRDHKRHYPPRGQIRKRLPKKAYSLRHSGRRYYYHDGIWYHRHKQVYRVTRPPIGIVVSILPPYYTRVWIGDIPYYYAGGVYYIWEPERRVYRVIEAPAEEKVVLDHEDLEPLMIYPKKGQSEKKLADDRYECHRWSLDNTGFNPILPSGNVPLDQYSEKRSDYYRAMKACLVGREYTVR